MPDQPSPGQIEIRINSVAQLFNSFDPSPFQERDLDDNAEEFIVGSALEFHRNEKLRIIVHMPARECLSEGAKGLASAVAKHFDYRVGVMKRELAELFRAGRRYLLVGVSIFAACHVLAEVIRNAFPGDTFAEGVEQGLIIIGWVANWKPFDILLYDWWPLRRRIRLFQRLAEAEIEVRPAT
ncbi:MAG: hypothetical protein Q8R02_06090 [Hyphomonadaceae bacterium]|nr:hypothetical protein [Hyphomonadaceae bacterium]